MPVVEHRIQKIFAVHRVPSDLLDSGPFPLFKNHPVKELVTFLYADILSDDIIDIVVRIQDLHLNMEQPRLAFDANKVAGLLVKQPSIYIDLHV